MVVEVCSTGVSSALRAEENGADRIELCMHLGSGGLTPSFGLLKQVLRHCSIPVFVLIRPREGNFVYTAQEKACIVDDVKAALDLGAHGLVVGALTPEGEPDLGFICSIRQYTDDQPITFHRAFDECTTPAAAAAGLHELGIQRILTSGQALRASSGLRVYEALMKLEKCPAILAGGGVTPDNVHELLQIGIEEVHFSARKEVYGQTGRGIFNPAHDEVDGALVRQMREAIDAYRRDSKVSV